MDAPPTTTPKWSLTQEAFDNLLAWLSPDREQAGEMYEQTRLLLIKGFRKHGCTVPEELADETINRVAKKLPEIISTYTGNPMRYFYGVAHHVHMEYLRRPKVSPLLHVDLPCNGDSPPFDLLYDEEPEYDCLQSCVEHLSPPDRELILHYYRGERQVKIRLRKELAERLGIKMENLRLRAQRIRDNLKRCIIDCVSQKAMA